MKIVKFYKIFKILKAYKGSITKILFFEFFYFLKGYKGNNLKKINIPGFTDNIPCPYFFLNKIKEFIIKYNIKSLVDLGCGLGRVLYFVNEQTKIHCYGVEYDKPSYDKCKKLFQNKKRIVVSNDNFMSFKFLSFKSKCFFLNDPVKKKKDFVKLILNILNSHNKKTNIIYFILINVNKKKREIFDKYKVIESYQINDRGYYIYSNKKK